jgi:hypothetical protein
MASPLNCLTFFEGTAGARNAKAWNSEATKATQNRIQEDIGMKRIIVAAVCELLVAVFVMTPFQPTAAEQPAAKPIEPKADEQQPSFWMRKKLDYSQNILAGIATADFDKIVENAEAMRALGKIEGFIRGRTPGYRTQLQIFEESNKEILYQATRDNVEGAALAFTQLTISCVNCHKQLREHSKK